MKTRLFYQHYLAVSCTALVLALSGCNDDNKSANSSAPTPNPTVKYADLTGTAAVGAAIKNANVTANCKDGTGFKDAVKTDANGTWSGKVDESKFPCALQVKAGEQSYQSYASKAGNVNITPFTDLVVALASTQMPETWFKSANPALTDTQLNKALTDFSTQLKTKGYSLPADFNLLTSKFVVGDSFDKALDAFGIALTESATSIKNHAALIDIVKSGNLAQLPVAKNPNPQPTGSCAGNTNPWGCISITGSAAPQASFEHLGFSAVLSNGTFACDTAMPKANLQATTGTIDYSRFSTSNCQIAANSWYDTLAVNYQTINGQKKRGVTYLFYKMNNLGQPLEMLTFSCSEFDVTRPCAGLTLDEAGQTVTFNNTNVVSIAALSSTGKVETITLNGTLKFKAALPDPVKSDYGSMTLTGLEAAPVTFQQKNDQNPVPNNQSTTGNFKVTWSESTPKTGSLIPYVRLLDVQKGSGTSVSFIDDAFGTRNVYTCLILPAGSAVTTTRPCTGQLTVDEANKSVTLKDMVLINDSQKTITLNGTMTY